MAFSRQFSLCPHSFYGPFQPRNAHSSSKPGPVILSLPRPKGGMTFVSPSPCLPPSLAYISPRGVLNGK